MQKTKAGCHGELAGLRSRMGAADSIGNRSQHPTAAVGEADGLDRAGIFICPARVASVATVRKLQLKRRASNHQGPRVSLATIRLLSFVRRYFISGNAGAV